MHSFELFALNKRSEEDKMMLQQIDMHGTKDRLNDLDPRDLRALS